MDKIGTSVESWNKDSYQTNCDDFLKYILIYKEENRVSPSPFIKGFFRNFKQGATPFSNKEI